MDLVTRLEKLIVPVVNQHGLDLVRILLSGRSPVTLEVMIERLDQTSVTINDCVGASREISVLLDVEDPIQAPYQLEVTSPGLARPLIKLKDFQRFVGNEIKFQTQISYEGHKKFIGILERVTKTHIYVRLSNEEEKILEINHEDIRQAKLVPNFYKSGFLII